MTNFSIFSDPCEPVKCDTNKVCSRRTATSYECLCPQCNPKYDLVCGSNGWTYASECHLRKYSCNNQLSLNAQSNGPCGKYKCTFFLRLTWLSKPNGFIIAANKMKMSSTEFNLNQTISNVFFSLLAHWQCFYWTHLATFILS